MFPTLEGLLFDKVSRIRLDTIRLISICIHQDNVRTILVPSILAQTKNSNYLYRETVLFFIKETYPYVSEDIRKQYKECLEILSNDPVQNVKEIAL